MKEKIKSIILASVLLAHKNRELPSVEFSEIEIEVPKVQYHEFVRLRC